jgi:hypothetical protein
MIRISSAATHPKDDAMDDQTISRFWDNYLEKLNSDGVKPAVLHWHVHHREQYINVCLDRCLATHRAQDIECDLQDKGRNVRR